jgi:hypothetical protein
MKKLNFLLALALIAIVGCQSNASAQSLNTLRRIRIERDTILSLGGMMPPVANFCKWSGRICVLKPGTFSGAAEMSLSETESGLISQFRFYYGVTTLDAVKARIDDYTRQLGKPSRDSTVEAGGFDNRNLEWSDSSTTFRFSYKTDGKQAEASAILFDNALTGGHA